jgi:hypothetical protein
MRSIRTLLLRFSVLLVFAGLPIAHAQVVSSGITGVVLDESGKPVPGVTLSATHVPTGTVYTAISRPDGRYNFRGLNVGGPYTVSTEGGGVKPIERTGVMTQLGQDVDVNFTVQAAGDVVALEKFVVEVDPNELDSTATGAGTLISEARLTAKPTTQRSLADMISASPLVTLRSTSGDREESQITAVGQNARFNSIMIDGARINDQFGLNFTGLASFFNPLSLETLEQMTVDVSPYDVRQSGFTGAAINAVTKSGTNKFSGSLYYMFSGDELMGVQLQGEDVQTLAVSGRKLVPTLERTTYGATFGGPIVKNKLFFFLSYEKFERVASTGNAGFIPFASELAAIQARLSQISTIGGKQYNWGQPGGLAPNNTEDEKLMAKIDWNISNKHRLSVRYSTTEGSLPQFGSFTATSGARGVNSTPSGPGYAFDSYFYAQERKEKVYAAQFYSQWTADFKTEIKYSKTKQDQLTPTNSVLPLVNVLNVQGISQQGTPTTGIVFMGTEFSRHGNQIFVDTESYSATGEYFWKNFVITGGFDREQSDFYNLFRAGSYGQLDFNGTAAFTAGTVAAYNRSMYDPSIRPAADISDFAITGFFLQSKWDVAPRLTLTTGIRFDLTQSDSRPLFNQKLFSQTGFRNNGTVDGVTSVSPRVGFNWGIDDQRKVQVRGGVGRFLGRAPWVLFSNSYNQLGVGTFVDNVTPASLESYLTNSFNQADPIGKATDTGALDREVDWTDDKLKLPAVWRGNLAVDYRLPFLDSVLTVEGVETRADDSLFIRNENLKPIGTGADGRPRFAGNPGATNNTNTALYPDFLNLYRITNVSTGASHYYTISIDRPMRKGWAYNVSYTRGRATDAQIFGSTTAGSQWGRNAVFAQGQVETSRSDFEIKDRVQITIAKQFEFIRKWKTDASLYYEGRSGNPYSWVYTTDLNGDGRSDNDLMAIPKDVSDARFDFSSMSQTDRDAYFGALQSTGLMAYAGGYVPRNAMYQPWVNRLDLHLGQHIPIKGPAELELFCDFTNFGAFISKSFFGYSERTTLVESDTFWRRQLGGASYGTDGRIKPTYAAPTGIVYDNPQSRWRIQVGARLKF